MSTDLEAPSREIAETSDAVRLAIAAVKANPPHPESPLPWREDDMFVRCADYGGRVAQWVNPTNSAHIAAAVNAAPVLVAEVERLQAALDGARTAVKRWYGSSHDEMCHSQWPGDNKPNGGKCNCGSDDNNAGRALMLRVLGVPNG